MATTLVEKKEGGGRKQVVVRQERISAACFHLRPRRTVSKASPARPGHLPLSEGGENRRLRKDGSSMSNWSPGL